MNTSCFLVPMFIDEFQVLHDSGFICVDRSRVVITSPTTDGLRRPEVEEQIMETLPEFMPDAEHSVVIVQFSTPSPVSGQWRAATTRTSAHLMFCARDCTGVIPLSRRAAEILDGRFDGRIKMEPPVFENVLHERLASREFLNSIAGGDALVESLIANPEEFRLSTLPRLLSPKNGDDLVKVMMSYTRHKPMPREPISGLRDLGIILTSSIEEAKRSETPLCRLSEWIKPKAETTRGYRSVYGDQALLLVLASIDQYWKLPVSSVGLSIFLYWRDLALKAQGIDLWALASDLRELVPCVTGQQVIESVWLLGASAGFASFADSYYSVMENGHPMGAKRRPLNRVSLLVIQTPEKSTAKISCEDSPKTVPAIDVVAPTDPSETEQENVTPPAAPVRASAETSPSPNENPTPESTHGPEGGDVQTSSDVVTGPVDPGLTASAGGSEPVTGENEKPKERAEVVLGVNISHEKPGTKPRRKAAAKAKKSLQVSDDTQLKLDNDIQ